MALTNKPAPTDIQVGATAYFMFENIPQSATVVSTSSEVTNPELNNTGITKVVYYVEGYLKPFQFYELFSEPESLITHLASKLELDVEFPF